MTKISQLVDLGANLAADDVFVVRDVSDISTPNKKVTSSGLIDYVIAQGSVAGFTQIAAGAGPQSRVQCTSSGSTHEIIFTTAGVERLRVNSGGQVVSTNLGSAAAPTYSFAADTDTGVFRPAADIFAFSTAGAERMRTASGVLGVGDTNPGANAIRASFRGPVGGTESALPVVSIVRTNNVGGGTGVPETGLNVQIPNTFNGAGEVKGINVFARHNLEGTAYGIFAEAGGNASASKRYSGYFKVTQPDTNGGAINFAVYAQANSTIGVSSIGFAIGVTSETSNYAKNQNFRAISLYTGADTQTVLLIIRNGSAIGSITTSTTATAYNTSSDYRLKENVTPVTDGITRLQQLKPSRFNFIVDPEKTVDGFLAHEVQNIVPESIIGEKDAVDGDENPVYQGIDQSKLVPLLTAALQEAIAKIESLEARLTAAGID